MAIRLNWRIQYGKGVLDLTLDERFLAKVSEPGQLLDQIGLIFVGQIQRGFDQGGLTEKWAPTMRPNIPAIAKRISEGKGVPDKYLTGKKKPLIDSGHLRRSIKHSVVGKTLFIGTNVEYGKVHQEGGTSTVDNKIPSLLKQKDTRTKNALKKVYKEFPKARSVLEKKEKITVNIRKRPYLVITPQMTKIAMRAVKQWLTRGL